MSSSAFAILLLHALNRHRHLSPCSFPAETILFLLLSEYGANHGSGVQPHKRPLAAICGEARLNEINHID